ncbi:hypothetical protein [Epilithonimonas xixisoli]|uniref:Uncharacterized protein n=1 Tax=Epilithonimonas xixisoli TaxID=1476462 RepID=A0A4R8IEZ8_9FLAO|nr:hypothetical protein [Epilithonimonas xixisoli]TDX83984.1 hypothetical protein B0I22_1572 [Epilithonimonas xixisoli]
MYIERKQEETPATSILHKVADIPNGVTIKTTGLANGTVIAEATPLYPDANGLYAVLGTAKVVEVAAANAVNYSVAKGHTLLVGQKLYKDASTNVDISAINTTDPTKDVVTVSATLGAKAIGGLLSQGNVAQSVAITGESHTVQAGRNVFASGWVIAVVNKNMSPEPANKPALVQYV